MHMPIGLAMLFDEFDFAISEEYCLISIKYLMIFKYSILQKYILNLQIKTI